MSDVFENESDFEEAVIKSLQEKGWEKNVLNYPTEEDLIKNWAEILFENNKEQDRLNGVKLTSGEMQQILEQITELKTPLKLNGFINGKSVSIRRDNEEDRLHFGKEVSLKIYDKQEIAAGQSRYQIAQQPQFPAKSKVARDRRGDLVLLINGMPLIHIELKRSGVSVTQAYHQIEKYAGEGVFSGLFSLVQIFVAMEPNETVYFANPGPEGKFNPDFYFHWADFDNEPINEWNQIVSYLLMILMAHQLIGFYTVPDDSDGVLKVLRSYQYYAANAISDKVAKNKNEWNTNNQLGGYIWHTTGSGKTMTSFKSAQLIANSRDADKVIFLMDRIELGTQSLKEYRAFADERETVQETEDTVTLISKLKSNYDKDTLIVTSIQKLSNLEEEGVIKKADLEEIANKRIVIIVDECHRSTFGEMLQNIKDSFPAALFFGFTGTPIHEENEKKRNTTSTIFGDELHRYSIADGIRDKNVLGFDPHMVSTYRDKDVRESIALQKAKSSSVTEAIYDPQKSKIYYKFMNDVKMAGEFDGLGNYIKGIEDYIPSSQYLDDDHQEMVVKDISDNWITLSHSGKFHAIFATSSIPEAIDYYQLLKTKMPDLKITALFDASDADDETTYKTDGLAEIITDYNEMFSQDFTIPTHAKFKKDVAARLAHKEPYQRIEREPKKELDLLIVVDQMLTGFDSKWVNTLYLDKKLKYENIIQAFSRTNRLFGPEKPFGTIRYYRKPHTMARNIKAAVKLYSGDKVTGLFVDKLEVNLTKMNVAFVDIKGVFENAGIENFKKSPDDLMACGKFAKLFKKLNEHLEAAKIQGFRWDNLEYDFEHEDGSSSTVTVVFDENIYLTLVLRYKELFGGGGGHRGGGVPFEIDGYLTDINTGAIDTGYMNSQFTKYLKLINVSESDKESAEEALKDLQKSFALLSQEEQKYANIFIHDIQRGEITVEEGKDFRSYITQYQATAKNDQISKFSNALGLDGAAIRDMVELHLNEGNLNEYGRFDALKEAVDKEVAKRYFEETSGAAISQREVNIKVTNLLREFVLTGGFDVDEKLAESVDAMKEGKDA
jgi:type I restriction enzyme R subunit